ncbi:MAG: hypothetical protein F6J86_36830 [Symploca sp. SIO1B1]|nr:hypothetical protein [Symploca sp. SIO1B1]
MTNDWQDASSTVVRYQLYNCFDRRAKYQPPTDVTRSQWMKETSQILFPPDSVTRDLVFLSN